MWSRIHITIQEPELGGRGSQLGDDVCVRTCESDANCADSICHEGYCEDAVRPGLAEVSPLDGTIDVPTAYQGWPAASGRWLRIEGGRFSPCTSEKFTPPCSSRAPSRSTLERPPPPSGRTQLSSWKRPSPSSCSSPAQMLSCSPINRAFMRLRESAGGVTALKGTCTAVAQHLFS